VAWHANLGLKTARVHTMTRHLKFLIAASRIICAVGALFSVALLSLSIVNMQFDFGLNLGKEDAISGVIFLITVIAVYLIGLPILRFVFRFLDK
jgi:hypothetical protein